MTTVFALAVLVVTLAWAAVLVGVHLQPTGYRPVSNAVSDYGVGPYRGWYRAQTALAAVAALALVGALVARPGSAPLLVVVLLCVFAAARLVIPSFPTDLDRSRPTRTGRIHVLLAGAAFASVAWAAAATPDRVQGLGAHGLLVALGWVVVATAVACGLAMSSALHAVTEPFFGAVERVFYAAMLLWFGVVAVQLI